MLGFLRREKKVPDMAAAREAAPVTVQIESGAPFDVQASMRISPEGFPQLDWDAAWRWTDSFETDERKGEAWAGCARAWLLHLREALGPGYWLHEGDAVVLSSLEPRAAQAANDFVMRTLSRVERVLSNVAVATGASRVLVVFDDEDTYYRYAAQFDADGGEYAFSSGMHISRGLPHFITRKEDLGAIEPVIAHELTHACLGHLPIPLWLNEGLAVNAERRLCGAPRGLHTPQEMHAKHVKFWDASTIQEFWSGQSFRRPDDGNMLSYDMARVLVEQLGVDWARFAAFVNAAHRDDAGRAAAAEHLRIELGAAVAAMLEQQAGADWSPDPQRWKQLESRTE